MESRRNDSAAEASRRGDQALLALLTPISVGFGPQLEQIPGIEAAIARGLSQTSSRQVLDAATNTAVFLILSSQLEKRQFGRRLMELLARDGNIAAQGNLAVELIKGAAGPREPARAVTMLKEVVNSPAASPTLRKMTKKLLGTMLLQGDSCERDIPQAVNLLEDAAAAGDGTAACMLGILYEGRHKIVESISVNVRTAATYYRQAIAAGSTLAAINLALLIGKFPAFAQGTESQKSLILWAAQRGDGTAKRLAASHF